MRKIISLINYNKKGDGHSIDFIPYKIHRHDYNSWIDAGGCCVWDSAPEE